MNYVKHYNLLIATRQQLDRNKRNGVYELHHIVPRSMGGSNERDNLVLLTPREHYIAHWLLYKSHTGSLKAKMAYAFFRMSSCNGNQKRVLTSRQREIAVTSMRQACTGVNHPNYGRTLSDEQKNAISERQKGKGNSMYGKMPWNKGLTKDTSPIIAHNAESMSQKYKENGHHCSGVPRTDETKVKISKSHKGKKLSDETKQKLRDINKGKKLSDETKQRMSMARKGRVQENVSCPHCGKVGGAPSMKRWHFDNCKAKR